MRNKINVGIIFGGRSGEHEVSLVSATSVMKALNKDKYNIVPIGITKKGKWIVGRQAMKELKVASKNIEQFAGSYLLPDPSNKRLVTIKNNEKHLITDNNTERLDVVFPVLHGTYGEDGTLQGLLEMAGVAYVGAGVLGSAVAMDKVVQKQLALTFNIPIVDFEYFVQSEWDKDRDKILKKIIKSLGFPSFVKPANMGSSVGVAKAKNMKELIGAIKDALLYDSKIIVEKGVNNAREIECSVLGNDNPQASVLGEVRPSNEFYDYNAKYVEGKSELEIPASLSTQLSNKIRELAIKAFKSVDCKGMARVDFLLEEPSKKIYLNELNTIPGFTSISMYPKLWEASGIKYPDLLDKLIELAIERQEQKNKLQTSFAPIKEWYKD